VKRNKGNANRFIARSSLLVENTLTAHSIVHVYYGRKIFVPAGLVGYRRLVEVLERQCDEPIR